MIILSSKRNNPVRVRHVCNTICIKARTAKRKDVQKAIDTLLNTNFLLPFISDAVSIAEETPRAKDLMKDDMGLIIVMLAYYNWKRWKAKNKRDVETLLSLMLT